MPRPMTVRVTSILMAGSGLLLGVWSVATFSKFGQFSMAAHKIFDADPYADMSVGSLQIDFLTGAVLSMILACVLLVLTSGVYWSSNRVRIVSPDRKPGRVAISLGVLYPEHVPYERRRHRATLSARTR